MRLIVLTGLVSVEKIDFATQLAQHFWDKNQSVTLIDNVARLQIEPRQLSLPEARVIRHTGDIRDSLPSLLAQTDSDIVILAASEQVSPNALFMALDSLHTLFRELDIQTIALIDDRTCDCFPAIRGELEAAADLIITIPFDFGAIVQTIS